MDDYKIDGTETGRITAEELAAHRGGSRDTALLAEFLPLFLDDHPDKEFLVELTKVTHHLMRALELAHGTKLLKLEETVIMTRAGMAISEVISRNL